MNYLDSTKFVVGIVAAASSSAVVTQVIKNNVPELTKADKVKVTVGTFVIGGLVASQAKKFVHGEIDDIVKTVKEVKAKLAEKQEESSE